MSNIKLLGKVNSSVWFFTALNRKIKCRGAKLASLLTLAWQELPECPIANLKHDILFSYFDVVAKWLARLAQTKAIQVRIPKPGELIWK